MIPESLHREDRNIYNDFEVAPNLFIIDLINPLTNEIFLMVLIIQVLLFNLEWFNLFCYSANLHI